MIIFFVHTVFMHVLCLLLTCLLFVLLKRMVLFVLFLFMNLNFLTLLTFNFMILKMLNYAVVIRDARGCSVTIRFPKTSFGYAVEQAIEFLYNHRAAIGLDCNSSYIYKVYTYRSVK